MYTLASAPFIQIVRLPLERKQLKSKGALREPDERDGDDRRDQLGTTNHMINLERQDDLGATHLIHRASAPRRSTRVRGCAQQLLAVRRFEQCSGLIGR